MLSVDEGHFPTQLLGFSQDVQGQGCLAGGFGTIDLYDAALGDTANAQGNVQSQGTGGDRFDCNVGVLPQAHDRTLAIGPLNLGHGSLQCLLLVISGIVGRCCQIRFFRSHFRCSSLKM